jgi:ATP synthase protein I
LAGKDEEKTVLRQLFEASTVGIHLVLCTFAGLAIGYGLDVLFGTAWLKFVFLFVGIAAGFRELFRIAKKQEDRDSAGTTAADDKKDK